MNRNTAPNSTYKKLAVQWLNEALCFVSSSVVADSLVLRNRQLLKPAKRYRKPYDDSANIKRTDMRRTFLDYINNRLTVIPTSQRNEVLFFANAHFLFFNFLAAAQVAHFVLPLKHKPTQRQNKKSHFSNALLIAQQL